MAEKMQPIKLCAARFPISGANWSNTRDNNTKKLKTVFGKKKYLKEITEYFNLCLSHNNVSSSFNV